MEPVDPGTRQHIPWRAHKRKSNELQSEDVERECGNLGHAVGLLERFEGGAEAELGACGEELGQGEGELEGEGGGRAGKFVAQGLAEADGCRVDACEGGGVDREGFGVCGVGGRRGWWERGRRGEGDEGCGGKWFLVLFTDSDAWTDEARCDSVLDEDVVGGFFGAAPEHGRWELVGEVGTWDL